MPAGDNGRTAPRDPMTNRFVRVLDRKPEPTIRPASDVWIGYVMVPAKGSSTNAWYLRKVAIPVGVVEKYGVEARRCRGGDPPDQRQVQASKVLEHLRDPEMIRDWDGR